MRERLINRRQQGDLGEASAIDWFTRHGATVLIPLGNSPDYDLVVDDGNGLLRVQVKTSVFTESTPGGRLRHSVRIATNGGNQSWTGVVRRFDSSRADALFVLTGDGRRWLIPAHAVEAATAINLGGPKYSEFEVEPASPLAPLVYGDQESALESSTEPGEYPSGQRTAAVNRLAQPSQVRILSPPSGSDRLDRPKFERSVARSGQTVIGVKRRLGIPIGPCEQAGLNIGDRMRVSVSGPGRLILERIDSPGATLAANVQPRLDLDNP